MRSWLLTFVLLNSHWLCYAQIPAERIYEGSLLGPSALGGYVLAWDSPYYKHVLLYRPDGKLAVSAPVGRADEQLCAVWALDTDGIAARACESHGKQGVQGSIAFLDQSGATIRTITTGSYLPQQLAFAPDHSLWSAGFPDADKEGRTVDFSVVHHYNRSGESLSESVPWGQIAVLSNAPTALQLVLGGKWMFASNNWIWFHTFSGSGHATWVGISSEGTLLGQYDLGTRALSLQPTAMTTDGTVYAKIWKDQQKDGWARLDRSQGIWHRITDAPPGELIGTDGNQVVFAQHAGNSTVLVTMSPETLHAAAEPLSTLIAPLL